MDRRWRFVSWNKSSLESLSPRSSNDLLNYPSLPRPLLNSSSPPSSPRPFFSSSSLSFSSPKPHGNTPKPTTSAARTSCELPYWRRSSTQCRRIYTIYQRGCGFCKFSLSLESSSPRASEPPLQCSSTAENFRKHELYDLNFCLEPPQRDADDIVLEEEDNVEGPDKAESCDVELIDGAQQTTVGAAVQDILCSISLLSSEERDQLALKMCTSIPDHLAQTQKHTFDISAIERMTHGMQNDEITAMSKQIQVMLRKRSRELITKSRRIEDGARFLIRKKPFLRLVREVAEAQNCSLHFSAEAIEALQMYAEAFLVELLTLSDRLTGHAKRVQLMPADLNLALDICKSNYQPIVPPSLIQCKSALGVLLVGLPKAGKTSILHKINLGDIGSSSADDSIRRVRYRNITFTKWTLDGGHSVSVPKSIGEEQADVLMFVVDSARSEVFDSARAVLNSILDQEHFEKSLLLVCSHKADLSDAISESEIITHLGLCNLERRIWHVQCTSTVTGIGMYEALDWIVNHRP